MTSFTPWQATNAYPAGDAPFDVTRTGGPQPFYHNLMDERRSMWRSTPEATYPDGYLGTLNTRRQDRLLNNLISRAQTRPYSRGVHKGERIDGRDYFFPAEFTEMSGLELQSMAEWFDDAPTGYPDRFAQGIYDTLSVGRF